MPTKKKGNRKISLLKTELERRRKIPDARVSLIREEYESAKDELKSLLTDEQMLDEESGSDRKGIARLRRSD